MLLTSGEGLARVSSLRSGESNQLGSRESEGSSNEHRAQPFEAVVKGTGVAPVLSTNVSALGSTTACQDDAEDDETYHCDDLDDREHEFGFTITLDTEQVDGDNDEEEDGDPG